MGATKLFPVGEHARVTSFLAAIQLKKDEVFRICAAEIMYHCNCMSSYL